MKVIRFLIAFEIAMWRSLYRWIFRWPRTRTPAGVAFGYTRVAGPLLWAFIAVSAVELPVLHLLLPWHVVRLVVDIISVYGLLWMFGLMASLKVHPHVAEESGLRLRNGSTIDIELPWDAIEAVRVRMRGLDRSKSVQYADGVLKLVVASRTDIEVVLTEPRVIPLPQTGGEPVTEVHFAVDEPRELARLINANRVTASDRA
jgi:hypothetical protein